MLKSIKFEEQDYAMFPIQQQNGSQLNAYRPWMLQYIMIEYVLTAVLIMASWFAYACIIRPKRVYQNYVREFQKRGYRVYQIPFKPLAFPYLDIVEKDEKSGDALKILKNVYPKYDVVISNILNKILIDLVNLDLQKSFFTVDNIYLYPKQMILLGSFLRALGPGLVFSEGKQWKEKRKIFNAIFKYSLLSKMALKIGPICDEVLDKFEKTHKIEGSQTIKVQLLDMTSNITSNIILEGFLGGKISHLQLDGHPVHKFICNLMDKIGNQSFELCPLIFGYRFYSLGLFSSHREINRRITLYNNWGHGYLKAKIQQISEKLLSEGPEDKKEPEDIIEAILRAEQSEGKQTKYSVEQIFSQFNSFFVAGTDTTANILVTMVYYICRNPEVEKKIRDQIAEFMKQEDYSLENLKKMAYIERVQKETLRIAGPVPQLFIREASKDNYINKVPITKGTQIGIPSMACNYSEEYYIDPFKFRPERWETECNELPPLAFGGFGAGQRMCIGMKLAYLESKIALIKIMKKFSHIQIKEGAIKMQYQFMYATEPIEATLTLAK